METTKEERTFTDNLHSSKLSPKLVNLVKPIVANHMKQCLENKSLKYDEIGTNREKRFKKAVECFVNLQTITEDLDKVILFLKTDKDNINKLYPSLTTEDYYNYHLENYIIRINSIPDALAQLGNIVCNLQIKKKNCSAHSFLGGKFVKKNPELKKIMLQLLRRIDAIKKMRNAKIHEGSTDIDYFKSVTSLDYISQIGMADPLIEEYALEKKNDIIESMKNEINEVIKFAVNFLDCLEPFLK